MGLRWVCMKLSVNRAEFYQCWAVRVFHSTRRCWLSSSVFRFVVHFFFLCSFFCCFWHNFPFRERLPFRETTKFRQFDECTKKNILSISRGWFYPQKEHLSLYDNNSQNKGSQEVKNNVIMRLATFSGEMMSLGHCLRQPSLGCGNIFFIFTTAH